jgi:branched-chain amino acid transport system permease protein
MLAIDFSLFFTQIMNGIGNGAVYAALALALVLIFRTTGILNFAQGEMALYSAYLYWYFATQQSFPVVVAIVLAVGISFVGGAVIERVLIRPVEHSSPLVIVIVTIGLFLALNSIVQVQFGSDIKTDLPRFYSQNVWRPGNVQVSADTLVLLAMLGIACFLLYLLFQHTKIGLAMRAVASNSESTELSGVPVGTMLMLGWGLAAALGALAGILVIPQLGLQASSMQGILVYSFAAAALGGFDSPVGAVVGGMIVGVAQALTIQYIPALSDIVLIVPFGIILGVLMVRPQGLFGTQRVERV